MIRKISRTKQEVQEAELVTMVIGIGTDIIEVGRVKKACEKESFRRRVYTSKELELIEADLNKSVTNFAVKEAVSKMLGTGFTNIMPIEIEVLRKPTGQPYVQLHGNAYQRMQELEINDIQVTISDTKDYAVAYVIGQKIE